MQPLNRADAQLSGALSAEAEALVGKQRALLYDYAWDYTAAAATTGEARSTMARAVAEAAAGSEAAALEDPRAQGDDLLRHRLMIQRWLAAAAAAAANPAGSGGGEGE
eukprot:SAG22_NODE_1692_length_3804_cov_7.159784_2_plen_108_part_00